VDEQPMTRAEIEAGAARMRRKAKTVDALRGYLRTHPAGAKFSDEDIVRLSGDIGNRGGSREAVESLRALDAALAGSESSLESTPYSGWEPEQYAALSGDDKKYRLSPGAYDHHQRLRSIRFLRDMLDESKTSEERAEAEAWYDRGHNARRWGEPAGMYSTGPHYKQYENTLDLLASSASAPDNLLGHMINSGEFFFDATQGNLHGDDGSPFSRAAKAYSLRSSLGRRGGPVFYGASTATPEELLELREIEEGLAPMPQGEHQYNRTGVPQSNAQTLIEEGAIGVVDPFTIFMSPGAIVKGATAAAAKAGTAGAKSAYRKAVAKGLLQGLLREGAAEGAASGGTSTAVALPAGYQKASLESAGPPSHLDAMRKAYEWLREPDHVGPLRSPEDTAGERREALRKHGEEMLAAERAYAEWGRRQEEARQERLGQSPASQFLRGK